MRKQWLVVSVLLAAVTLWGFTRGGMEGLLMMPLFFVTGIGALVAGAVAFGNASSAPSTTGSNSGLIALFLVGGGVSALLAIFFFRNTAWEYFTVFAVAAAAFFGIAIWKMQK